MERKSIDKKKLMEEIVANDFAKLNGVIIRSLGNILGPGWQRMSDLLIALRDKQQSDIYFSLDYLQQLKAIDIREKETKEIVDIYDFDLEDVQIRLTPYGVKLLMVTAHDELIDI
jgi:Tol biopolymer transport system component